MCEQFPSQHTREYSSAYIKCEVENKFKSILAMRRTDLCPTDGFCCCDWFDDFFYTTADVHGGILLTVSSFYGMFSLYKYVQAWNGPLEKYDSL